MSTLRKEHAKTSASTSEKLSKFEKGDQVVRKGELCTVLKVDYSLDPAGYTVQVNGTDRVIGTEESYLSHPDDMDEEMSEAQRNDEELSEAQEEAEDDAENNSSDDSGTESSDEDDSETFSNEAPNPENVYSRDRCIDPRFLGNHRGYEPRQTVPEDYYYAQPRRRERPSRRSYFREHRQQPRRHHFDFFDRPQHYSFFSSP